MDLLSCQFSLFAHNINTGTNLMMYDMWEVSYGIVSQVWKLVS